MSDVDTLGLPSPWHPITDAVDLKHLGKFGEEANELATVSSRLATAIFRCIIQGVDEREPTTGKPNREWLEDEIADVLGNSELVIERFGLDAAPIRARAEKKKAYQRIWHKGA